MLNSWTYANKCLAQDALSKGCMPDRNPPLVEFVFFFGLGGSSPKQLVISRIGLCLFF